MKALTEMNIVEFELLVPRIDDFISLNISSKKIQKEGQEVVEKEF